MFDPGTGAAAGSRISGPKPRAAFIWEFRRDLLAAFASAFIVPFAAGLSLGVLLWVGDGAASRRIEFRNATNKPVLVTPFSASRPFEPIALWTWSRGRIEVPAGTSVGIPLETVDVGFGGAVVEYCDGSSRIVPATGNKHPFLIKAANRYHEPSSDGPHSTLRGAEVATSFWPRYGAHFLAFLLALGLGIPFGVGRATLRAKALRDQELRELRGEPLAAEVAPALGDRRRRRRLYVAGGLVFFGFLFSAIYGACSEFWNVDRCLDRGGRWNRTTGACEPTPRGTVNPNNLPANM